MGDDRLQRMSTGHVIRKPSRTEARRRGQNGFSAGSAGARWDRATRFRIEAKKSPCRWRQGLKRFKAV